MHRQALTILMLQVVAVGLDMRVLEYMAASVSATSRGVTISSPPWDRGCPESGFPRRTFACGAPLIVSHMVLTRMHMDWDLVCGMAWRWCQASRYNVGNHLAPALRCILLLLIAGLVNHAGLLAGACTCILPMLMPALVHTCRMHANCGTGYISSGHMHATARQTHSADPWVRFHTAPA